MNKELENKRPEEPVTGEENAVSEEAAPVDAGQEEEKAARLSWEEILADPAYRKSYDAAVQGIVKARLRGRAQAEEKLNRLSPVLQVLEERFGLTDESDADTLAAQLRESADSYRPRGEDVAAHLEAMLADAEKLRQNVPDFDLTRELEDPVFVRMTAPHSGISLADAYYARHRAEREREMTRRNIEAVSRSLQSAAARPRELRETGAGERFTLNPGAMSRAEREALKKRILEAKAQGRKLGVGE